MRCPHLSCVRPSFAWTAAIPSWCPVPPLCHSSRWRRSLGRSALQTALRTHNHSVNSCRLQLLCRSKVFGRAGGPPMPPPSHRSGRRPDHPKGTDLSPCRGLAHGVGTPTPPRALSAGALLGGRLHSTAGSEDAAGHCGFRLQGMPATWAASDPPPDGGPRRSQSLLDLPLCAGGRPPLIRLQAVQVGHWSACELRAMPCCSRSQTASDLRSCRPHPRRCAASLVHSTREPAWSDQRTCPARLAQQTTLSHTTDLTHKVLRPAGVSFAPPGRSPTPGLAVRTLGP